MKKIITLVFAVLLYATAVSAQSYALLEAIRTAEEHQKQGRLVEAIETLTAIKPTATGKLPDDFLEKPYDTKDETLAANEFYLKDTALRKLVNVLLETKNSGTAATTALHIENKNLRNSVLLNILERQCYAADKGEHNLMIGKAEETVLLLTGEHRDEGYERIVSSYVSVRKFDSAFETAGKIVPGKHQDRGHATIAVGYA
jgi:hypothetical protein